MAADPRNSELLLSIAPGVVLGALVEAGRTVEAWWEPAAADPAVGDVFLGRVANVRRELAAAFVDIGGERLAFLPLGEAGAAPVEGATALVQVVAPALDEKAPRLTGAVRLEGRYLVRVLGEAGLHLSQRIPDQATRQRLDALFTALSWPGAGAVIARSRAAVAAPEAIAAEAARLAATEAELRQRAATGSAPCRVHAAPSPVVAAILAHGEGAVAIRIDDAAALAAARRFVAEAMPELASRLAHAGAGEDVFAAADVEGAIRAALEPEVPLAGGGHLLIEAGRTLTAIDVNSGVPETGQGREATALVVNLAAAEEIARQLRLRGIGGLIVIDFLRLRAATDRARVSDALAAALARDPAPTRVLPFSALGLVEMTRRRPRGASGFAAAAGAAALLLRRIGREAAASAGPLVVTASVSVAAALAAAFAGGLAGLEAAVGRRVRVVGDPGRAADRFEVQAEARTMTAGGR
ncbi:MAG: hypothetical protein EXQ96_07060 [Alphaproteobacteria bacterium]|nr:hypothetical protein [Alphaproteobacteria bacterium]